VEGLKNMIIRREVLKAVQTATSKDDTRYALGNIQVQPDGACVATDGHVLLVGRDRYPAADEDFPTANLPEFSGDPKAPVLLPADVVTKLIAGTPKRTPIPILQSIRIGVNGGPDKVYAVSTDLQTPTVYAVPTEEQPQFPVWERVIPKERTDTRRIILGVPVLETLLKAAKAAGSTSITFEVPTLEKHYSKQEPICLVESIPIAITSADVELAGVIMPVRG